MATLNEIWAKYPGASTIDVTYAANTRFAGDLVCSARSNNMKNWFVITWKHGRNSYMHGDSDCFEPKPQSWTSGPPQNKPVPHTTTVSAILSADENIYGDFNFVLPGHCSKCASPLKAIQLFTSTVEVCLQCEAKAS